MKITGIHINDYQQFNDFHLDLTYPKGHEKEGKPLDKVCFIGQSGTGKTTLLKFIFNIVSEVEFSPEPEFPNKREFQIDILCNNSKTHLWKGNLSDNSKYVVSAHFTVNDFFNYNSIWKIHTINIPAEILDKLSFTENKEVQDPFKYLKIVNEVNDQNEDLVVERINLRYQSVYDFNNDNPIDIWKLILMDASNYMIKELNYSQKITKELLKYSTKVDALINEVKRWRKENPNPFKDLAKLLNPIIERFNIKVKEDFDFEKAEDLGFIKLETLNGSFVPANVWSTGTKQVVLTAIPLYKLETNNTIILIDEPERSLYPDIQQEIIGYYTQLALKAQFFFATHSPIIASSFEPWEIVELKFDYEKGKVYQEKYFEGERHIDNYFINPQYLRWDSILTKVFDLKERGNEKRIEKLMELAALGKSIEKEPSKAKKTKIYKEYQKLSELLDWETK